MEILKVSLQPICLTTVQSLLYMRGLLGHLLVEHRGDRIGPGHAPGAYLSILELTPHRVLSACLMTSPHLEHGVLAQHLPVRKLVGQHPRVIDLSPDRPLGQRHVLAAARVLEHNVAAAEANVHDRDGTARLPLERGLRVEFGRGQAQIQVQVVAEVARNRVNCICFCCCCCYCSWSDRYCCCGCNRFLFHHLAACVRLLALEQASIRVNLELDRGLAV